MSSDPLAHLRSLAIEKPCRIVQVPVLVWSILFWLHGFVIGVALIALLLRR